jgi:AcrR family transcriptional regulator
MTREDIITAAFRVWGRELYQSTSLTQLAVELGVTKPALYRHFPHKQALLDGMYEWFFDDCAAFIKDDYDKAVAADDPVEGLLILSRVIARYYCLDENAFLFALVRVCGNRNDGVMADELAKRGVDMGKLGFSKYLPEHPHWPGVEGDASYPPLAQLVFVTLMFWIGFFHKYRNDGGGGPGVGSRKGAPHAGDSALSQTGVEETVASVEEKILYGLGFSRDRVDGLNYRELEERIAGLIPGSIEIEDDRLYRAVAGALAEAGPWEVSMEMVARRSGLSKSGLYTHFKNKRDMIHQFFWTEYERIAASADIGKAKSAAPEEQLYLAIIAIADYLRSRPEILLAIDRIGTRKPDPELSESPPFYRMFAGINVEALCAGCSTRERSSQWILFLVVSVLMRWPGGGEQGPASHSRFAGVENSCFRILYRFIVLGIRGFEAGGNDDSAKADSGYV